MPATSSTSSSTSSVSTSSQPQNQCQTGAKVENVKQIGICVAPGIPPAVCSSTKFQASSVSGNYYNAGGTTAGATTTVPSIPMETLQSLGLMVTRFANDPSSRHQTVILHPRPPGRGSTATTCSANVVPGAGAAAAIRTVATVPISNTTVRTQLPQQASSQPSTIQVMNLSVSNPATNASQGHQQGTVKQVCPPSGRFNITSAALPIESLELVVTNDSAAARPIRIHPDVNIVNVKPTSTSGSLHHNMAKLARASVMTNQQPAKMINLHGTAGTGVNAGATSQVARFGIIGQLPSSTAVTTTAGNKPVINTLTLTKPLQILNPSPNVASSLVNSGGTTVHSVVNVSNVASLTPSVVNTIAQAPQKPNQTVMTLATTANVTHARAHALIATNSAVHSVAYPQQTRATTNTTSTTSAALTVQHYNQQQHASSTASTTPSTPLRPNILSSPANSPIKQAQMQQGTPSSPRPSILIRKRIGNEVISNAYKSPTKVVSVVSSDSVKANKKADSKDEETGKVSDNGTRTAPLTPNSDAGGATPRKKPRKQLLEPFNLTTSQNIKLLSSNDDNGKGKEERDTVENKEGIITICKKPRPSLLTTYNVAWKSLQYHFLRYSDVRQKSDKKQTLSELSNEGLQRKNGWKIHHLGTQMDDISDNEQSVYERLTNFLDNFERNCDHLPNNITLLGVATLNAGRQPVQASLADKFTDLIRGNLQRSSLFQEQICESKQLLVKLTNDHKERVGKLTKKCANKRTYITK